MLWAVVQCRSECFMVTLTSRSMSRVHNEVFSLYNSTKCISRFGGTFQGIFTKLKPLMHPRDPHKPLQLYDLDFKVKVIGSSQSPTFIALCLGQFFTDWVEIKKKWQHRKRLNFSITISDFDIKVKVAKSKNTNMVITLSFSI